MSKQIIYAKNGGRNTGSSGGGSGGTDDHSELTNRDANNQHPISAITDLADSLAAKQNALNRTVVVDLSSTQTITDEGGNLVIGVQGSLGIANGGYPSGQCNFSGYPESPIDKYYLLATFAADRSGRNPWVREAIKFDIAQYDCDAAGAPNYGVIFCFVSYANGGLTAKSIGQFAIEGSNPDESIVVSDEDGVYKVWFKKSGRFAGTIKISNATMVTESGQSISLFNIASPDDFIASIPQNNITIPAPEGA
jgi:hypothetical protein